MTAPPRRARAFSRLARPDVDEAALARRYQRDTWTVAECARRFGISERQVREVLDRHGIARRRHAVAAVDPGVVVAAYRRHQSIPSVAIMLGTSRDAVQAVLDQAGVPHGRPASLPDFAARQHQILACYRAAPPVPPAPSDLLTGGQAARLPGVAPAVVRAAGRTGPPDPTVGEAAPAGRPGSASPLVCCGFGSRSQATPLCAELDYRARAPHPGRCQIPVLAALLPARLPACCVPPAASASCLSTMTPREGQHYSTTVNGRSHETRPQEAGTRKSPAAARERRDRGGPAAAENRPAARGSAPVRRQPKRLQVATQLYFPLRRHAITEGTRTQNAAPALSKRGRQCLPITLVPPEDASLQCAQRRVSPAKGQRV